MVSESLTDLIADCSIKPGYRLDHSILELNLVVNPFQRGRGLWKLNCSLLKNPEYLKMINHTIQDVLLSYVVPVYNIKFITESNFERLQFVITDDVLLEMIMFKIREVTIKFSGTLKRKECQVEKSLIQDIEKLESNENASDFPAIETKKQQLLELRKYRMRGEAVRSRTRWLHSGEKPSKYFCSLEQKIFFNKTIKKIVLDNGDIIDDQVKILDHIKQYYAKLFKSRDDVIPDVNLHEIFRGDNICKLTESEALSLEGLVTIEEIGNALKKMKHNKTPGIDGFPAEFFKIFWGKLKVFCISRELSQYL